MLNSQRLKPIIRENSKDYFSKVVFVEENKFASQILQNSTLFIIQIKGRRIIKCFNPEKEESKIPLFISLCFMPN